MNTPTVERTFNLCELCCFPKGCVIDKEMQLMLATVLVPKLEAAGMKTAEWTLGALALEEPFLTQIKGITCRGCMHFECVHNTTPQQGRSDDAMIDITECGYAERHEANIKLAEALVPHNSIEGWAAQGIIVDKPFVMSSRKRFVVSFDVKHPAKGKTNINVSRKKGKQGEISVYGPNATVHYPLPRTASETSVRLAEIVASLV